MLLRAGELEDLFRSLFYAYQQVRIGRLLWQDNGRFCIPVMACSPQGATSSMVLTCGERSLMKQEWKNLEELIPHSILGITPSDTSETTHFGASIYELPEADFDTLQTFRELFHAGKERSIKTVLTHLLDDVLNTWHQHGQSVLEKLDLMSYYRQKMGLSETEISRDEVERRVEMLINAVRTLGTIEIKRNSDSITFVLSHQNDQSFPDPIVAVYGSLTEFDTSVVCKISPGKLNPDNVLVDGGSRVWPSDFVSIGQAPQWWDFICLEAAIRFDLSHAPDLLAWDGFEKCLSNSDRLDSRIEPKDIVPELNISIGLIEQIRRRAASETGFNPLPYQAGLLAWVVKAMTNYTPGSLLTQADKLRGAHLLLAAAMISESLTKISPSPLPAGGALRLDKENRVWIGDRMVTTLSGSRLKLLNCLYEQSGKAVNNRIITETVYDEKYDPLKDGQNQRIRQEIRRLREEIEPDPDRPRYILTVRENGYRLQPKGESEE
jgi:DNA-binding winged helix-turn-helix (wHTH) protein